MAAMRIDLAELLRPHAREPQVQLNLPEAARSGSRSQRLQRLQVGLFGLAAMVLVVGLANIIRTTAERTDAQVVAESVPQGVPAGVPTQPANDPLAEAGVVPGVEAEAPAVPGNAQNSVTRP